MRVKVDTVQKVLLGAALLAALAWNLAQAAEVSAVRLARGATGTRAEIALDAAPADFRVIHLRGPDRLVIDFPTSAVRRGAPLPAPAGIVRSVRYGQPQPGVARVVFDLAQPVAALRPQLEAVAGGGSRLVIEWPGDGDGASTSLATMPSSVDANALASMNAADRPAASVATTSTSPPTAARPAATRTPSSANAALATATSDAPLTSAPTPTASSITSTSKPSVAAATPSRAPGSLDAVIASVASNAIVAPPSTSGVTASPSTAAAQQPVVIAPAIVLPAPTRPLHDTNGRPLRPLVIAIDAGHGGQDPGAHGPSGRREKDVTLAIARELARQANATHGYKAFLTRDADFFIPLNERARLAKRAGADMFVSIHADAAENPLARGSSVFVLSLKGASSQRARWLANKENAADLIGGVRVEPGNTLASVLLDLTQSGNLKASEDVAGQVLSGLSRLGPNHKATVERANFAVLRTSDIPAMLVETAFISNPDEERRLTDPAQQSEIARAVFGGIHGYFVRTPPPGTMLAARADGEQVAAAVRSGGR